MPPTLRKLQSSGPIHRVRTQTGDEAWLVVGYDHTRALLGDDRLGRSHPDPGNAPRISDSVVLGGPTGNFDTEAADHARMRGLLLPHFGPKRMRGLQSRVQTLTRQLTERLAEHGPVADLQDAMAVPLPILVICELLGVPYEDRGQFRTWTQAAADVGDNARSQQGMVDLFGYGNQLVARKRQEPGDDVISRLCDHEDLADHEIAVLSMTLLFAGHETTVAQLAMSLLLLAEPSRWTALAADPGLIDARIPELQRYSVKGSGAGIPRYAREDVRIGDTLIRAGELVLLEIGAANHDPAVFADPDVFDPTRPVGAPLVFGHGPYYCPGASLATVELRAVLTELVPRFPTMRLAVPVEEIHIRTDVLTGGLAGLPVTW
ncbi:cytochrome P450 [Amycolatopsis sp. A1MSW2902]